MAYRDPVENLVERIKEIIADSKIRPSQFSGKRLNEVGDIYERYGYGTAKHYLIGKESYQEKVLVEILDEIHRSGIRPEMGAYILRKLRPILSYTEGK